MKVKFTGIVEENKSLKDDILNSISLLLDRGDFILGNSLKSSKIILLILLDQNMPLESIVDQMR